MIKLMLFRQMFLLWLYIEKYIIYHCEPESKKQTNKKNNQNLTVRHVWAQKMKPEYNSDSVLQLWL